MRTRLLPLILLAFAFTFATTLRAESKLEKRYAYTLKNLKLDKETAAKFGPVLKA